MMTTETKTMSAWQIHQAIHGLTRISAALGTAETMTRRKWTTGREQEVLRDDLSGWDATQIREAKTVGVDLWELAIAASSQIESMIAEWRSN